MFFSKPEPQSAVTPHNIAFLGTDALSLYWADILKNLGHRVFFLCPPRYADEYNATDFIYKDTARLKNPRNNFCFGHELPFAPDLLLITVSPERRKSNLTLLSPSALADTLIVSFCFPDQDAVLPEIVHKPVINAFFEGWINRSKNHISIYGHSPRVTFSLPDTSNEAAFLREIFEPAGITTVFSEQENNNLWNFAGPFLAHGLLTVCFGRSIFELAKNEEGRRQIDVLLEEISRLAEADNVCLPAAGLLARLYEIPSAYVSPLQKSVQTHNPLFFERLNSFLLSKNARNDKKYPHIHRFMREVYNKY